MTNEREPQQEPIPSGGDEDPTEWWKRPAGGMWQEYLEARTGFLNALDRASVLDPLARVLEEIQRDLDAPGSL